MSPKKRRKTTDKNGNLLKWVINNRCHNAWSVGVRYQWDWKCAICGGKDAGTFSCIDCGKEPGTLSGYPSAHHIVKKKLLTVTQWDYLNGIALCPHHHDGCRLYSAHDGAFFYPRIIEMYPFMDERLKDLASRAYDKPSTKYEDQITLMHELQAKAKIINGFERGVTIAGMDQWVTPSWVTAAITKAKEIKR